MKKSNQMFMVLFVTSFMVIFAGCEEPCVHTFEENWTYDGAYHWHKATCEHISEISEKAPHSFGEWEILKVPTNEEEGCKKRTCSICGCIDQVTVPNLLANFVLIPSGTLQIGTTVQGENEAFLSVQTVTIEKSFYMGKCEITQAEWKDIMGTNPSANVNPVAQGELEEKRPVEKVSWFDALVYCNKRSLLENLTPCYFINNSTNPDDWGTIPTSYKDDNYAVWNAAECNWNANGYRLPTEAEWEYAARAGDETEDTLVYSGTKNLSELINYAWYEENSDRRTHEVGKKLPNGFGLYDMSGNVSEWCWDKHSKNSPIVRSSAFNAVANRCSVSYRLYSANSEDRFYWIGLRVVRSSSN